MVLPGAVFKLRIVCAMQEGAAMIFGIIRGVETIFYQIKGGTMKARDAPVSYNELQVIKTRQSEKGLF
jgi:hypothetical protein